MLYIKTDNPSHQNYINPMVKKEIFDMIDKIYFNDFQLAEQTPQGGFKDTSDYELNKHLELVTASGSADDASSGVMSAEDDTLSENSKKNPFSSAVVIPFNKLLLKNKVKKLQIEHEVIGRKVSDIILENSKAFSVELQRVSEFKFILEDSFQICTIARRSLFMSEYVYLMPALKLVKKQLKKQKLISLLKTVYEIKYFVSIDSIFEKNKQYQYFELYFLCYRTTQSIKLSTWFK